ncbi:asparagine synthase (glutamine-hydrolyzing) [Tsuneonella sp. YG55]|uniref:asparagine synthase (glutamine-hydrolyzing) n=1 Tax=Tsuneonella litorea TaxID=2976475 RepID=A0A9X2VZM4_9SPHN|nr:asparagine synthase (glutamine-hydrolyzing) [Tsuneonella litorea]MCT2557789.1 asparagine synthase (glutamine-hydrolyzing) [Tsuneonella litorea]
MCGLTGFWAPDARREEDSAILHQMVAAIRSRGPDAKGIWTDPVAGIALGHRRLSVLELSDAGAQPMISSSGRFALVFNGEIYNHLNLRERMNGGSSDFRGHSDTETLLAGFERWGLTETLARSTGMFALACWDRWDRALYLARDRMGEKPLYYGWQGVDADRALLFGSELKAIVRHPAFEARIDRASVTAYFARLCVPSLRSIWAGINKVAPGTVLRIGENGESRSETYWDLGDVIAEGVANRVENPREAIELVHDRLAAAVRSQLISDVPLGAFLSGGIDSSLIVALMQQASGGTARTFSIGFEEAAFNEADHARAVAEHLQTDHRELVVTAEDARAVIPDLPRIYDEPFADSSQVPTFLVSQFARGHVTVALSGDGADELFGGYTRYASALAAWRRIEVIPAALRQPWQALAQAMPAWLDRAMAIAGAPNIANFYGRMTDQALGRLATRPGDGVALDHPGLSPVEHLMAQDQLGYLPDDVLVKVDRAAMAVSLETRVPFLDAQVVAASWRLASNLKHRPTDGGFVGKWVLRQILDLYVPRAIIERPKQGFGVPIAAWLRGPLREWADDLLAEDALRRSGLVDAARVATLWKRHRSGRADHAELLWAVLMLEAWVDQRDDVGTGLGDARCVA